MVPSFEQRPHHCFSQSFGARTGGKDLRFLYQESPAGLERTTPLFTTRTLFVETPQPNSVHSPRKLSPMGEARCRVLNRSGGDTTNQNNPSTATDGPRSLEPNYEALRRPVMARHALFQLVPRVAPSKRRTQPFGRRRLGATQAMCPACAARPPRIYREHEAVCLGWALGIPNVDDHPCRLSCPTLSLSHNLEHPPHRISWSLGRPTPLRMQITPFLLPCLLAITPTAAVPSGPAPLVQARGGAKCPPVWPAVNAELNRVFMTGNKCNDLARAAIRAIFHDCGSWDTQQGFSGGCDGSLVLGVNPDVELNRGENRGLATVAAYLRDAAARFSVSVADMTVFAGSRCPLFHLPSAHVVAVVTVADLGGQMLPSCSAPVVPRSRPSSADKTRRPRPNRAACLTSSTRRPTWPVYSRARATARPNWLPCSGHIAHRRSSSSTRRKPTSRRTLRTIRTFYSSSFSSYQPSTTSERGPPRC